MIGPKIIKNYVWCLVESLVGNHTQYSKYCDQLLKEIVKHSFQIYGNDTIVFNVHGLTHLANDAKNFGLLDNIPFENYLMRIKKMVSQTFISFTTDNP